MFPSKSLKVHRRKLLILGLIALLLFLAGPTAKWLWPTNWWGTSLIVLMNENEARPCGGFVTAYGTIKLPIGGATLQNSFAFPPVNLGQNTQPLRAVSVERKFWDLGDTMDLGQCGEQFAEAYKVVEGKFPSRVILVQSGLIENWLAAVNTIRVGEYRLDASNFFATTSRLVADIDRHDEIALEKRKTPLGNFGKKLLLDTALKPWRWYSVSRTFGEAQRNRTLYWHKPGKIKKSPWQEHPGQLVSISEWNLGGGKSSRYLDKQWRVSLRQRTQDLWDLTIALDVQHLGGRDEPLSQPWKGGFALEVLQEQPLFIPAAIEPGESFTYEKSFPVGSKGLQPEIGEYRLGLYAPAAQSWNTQLQVSALGQQTLQPQTRNLRARENVATWQGKLVEDGQVFKFDLQADKTSPFLTWHKPIASLNVAAQTQLELQHGGRDVIVEIHFNEPIELLGRLLPVVTKDNNLVFSGENLGIRLIDRDYGLKEYTEDPVVKTALLFADKQTLLLNMSPNQYQKDERFYLEIDAVTDLWGNTANIKSRTVITR